MLVDILNEQHALCDTGIAIVNNRYDSGLLAGIGDHVSKFLIGRRAGSRNPWPIIKLNRLLMREKPDVIHCHDGQLVNLLLPVFQRKSVLTVHAMNLEASSFRKYKRVFAISKTVQADIAERTGIHSILVYNGIRARGIPPKDLQVQRKSFRIVQISRLDMDIKGQDVAISAFKILKDAGYKDIQLDFIGEGSSEQFLKQMVTNNDLQNEIAFLGIKSRDYVYSHLKDYDLLIQPSHFEGFGLTIVEGMAAGVPVLTSKLGGPMEVINDGKFGRYFNAGDPQQLAEKIREVYDMRGTDTETAMIEAARTYAITQFNITQTARNYVRLYQEDKSETTTLR